MDVLYSPLKVKCSDCEMYAYQRNCLMENCVWHPEGYCAPCKCNHCDKDCTEPEVEKDICERPKYIEKK